MNKHEREDLIEYVESLAAIITIILTLIVLYLTFNYFYDHYIAMTAILINGVIGSIIGLTLGAFEDEYHPVIIGFGAVVGAIGIFTYLIYITITRRLGERK